MVESNAEHQRQSSIRAVALVLNPCRVGPICRLDAWWLGNSWCTSTVSGVSFQYTLWHGQPRQFLTCIFVCSKEWAGLQEHDLSYSHVVREIERRELGDANSGSKILLLAVAPQLPTQDATDRIIAFAWVVF